MAIWQYRLIFIPEKKLLSKYDVLPPVIPMELAEEFSWWSDIQPQAGFEKQIDLILPPMDSWSTSMRMWGQEECDDAYVCYVDESKSIVEEIAVRIDARSISSSLVGKICKLAKHLGCVLMTSDYEILAADEPMIMAAINDSTSKKFVEDPEATLRDLDHKKIEERTNFLMKDWEKKR
jgi:hypothetical protein